MSVLVRVVVCACFPVEMDVEFDAFDSGFGTARDVEVVPVEAEFFQLAFQRGGFDAEVDQGADEHVTADAAEQVEI